MTNADKLVDMLKFDPSKSGSVAPDVFQDALKEITEERNAKIKEEVKAQLKEAMDIQASMAKADREYASTRKKQDKALGKLINRLQARLAGKSPDEIEESEKDEKKDD